MSRDLASFLAANPAMTPRDWKGKGFTEFAPFDKHYVAAGEAPWDNLDHAEVRRLATTTRARFLSRGQRQAAARDPGLIWDERSRSYRLRADTTPSPSKATRAGRGHPNLGATSAGPAAATNSRPMTGNTGIFDHD